LSKYGCSLAPLYNAINPWSASRLSIYAAQYGTPDNGWLPLLTGLSAELSWGTSALLVWSFLVARVFLTLLISGGWALFHGASGHWFPVETARRRCCAWFPCTQWPKRCLLHIRITW